MALSSCSFRPVLTAPVRLGAILFVHGNQGGSRIGARETADSGTLLRFCSGLNITAAAASQPGFGASAGPPDFCGPRTAGRDRCRRCLSCATSRASIHDRIVLYGYSRGAVASAMVATEDADLRAKLFSAQAFMTLKQRAKPRRPESLGYRTGSRNDQRGICRTFGALTSPTRYKRRRLLLHGRQDDRAPVEAGGTVGGSALSGRRDRRLVASIRLRA